MPEIVHVMHSKEKQNIKNMYTKWNWLSVGHKKNYYAKSKREKLGDIISNLTWNIYFRVPFQCMQLSYAL